MISSFISIYGLIIIKSLKKSDLKILNKRIQVEAYLFCDEEHYKLRFYK